jgi:hypothetical protein
VDRDAGEVAIAAYTTTPLTKAVTRLEPQLHVLTGLGDGTMFATTNVPMYRLYANQTLNRLPSVKDAAALTRIHRKIVDRDRRTAVRHFPEEAERDPKKFLEQQAARQVTLGVQNGWGRYSADEKWVTHTWKCNILAYGAIWPFKNLFEAWVARCERKLLAELDGKPLIPS